MFIYFLLVLTFIAGIYFGQRSGQKRIGGSNLNEL